MEELLLPKIELSPELQLDKDKKKILKKLFAGQECITVEGFASGFSGSSLLKVTPIEGGIPSAPFAVKIGNKLEIHDEHERFKNIVIKYLKHCCSRIEEPLIDEKDLAGIKYTLITGDWAGEKVRNFKEYYESEEWQRICKTLKNLLDKMLGEVWYQWAKHEQHYLAHVYNRILPSQFTISNGRILTSCVQESFSNIVDLISKEDEIIDEEKICLRDLKVTEIGPQKVRVEEQDTCTKIDIIVLPGENIKDLRVCDIISIIDGKIIETRSRFLKARIEKEISNHLTKGSSLDENEICLESDFVLPNVISKCRDILNESVGLHMGNIHGDLNLANILIDANHNPWLIDYGKTQEKGHIAFDFAKLETEIKTHILANELDFKQFLGLERKLWESSLQEFRSLSLSGFTSEQRKAFEVISTIRRIATTRFLQNKVDQYLYSLFSYSLAALKFNNLDSQARLFAFISSAVSAARLLDYPLPISEIPGMILITESEFVMGISDEQIDKLAKKYHCKKEWFADERPPHKVYLDAYYIDKYPITNQQYKEFIDATAYEAPKHWEDGKYPENTGDHPVVNASWIDADTYAKWARKRLPTEAEWEKAARGTNGRLWPWGDEFDESKCNYDSKRNYHRLATSPVTQYPNGASPYGVMDMVGNVWEWVADWYDDNYYRNCPEKNPKGPNDGTWRVLRGGPRLRVLNTYARCTARNRSRVKDPTAGFRCAKSISS